MQADTQMLRHAKGTVTTVAVLDMYIMMWSKHLLV